MPRKQFKITEEKIKKLIAEGRGQGEGAAYQPWLQIGNFSSTGRGSRIRDHRTGRIHHLFSELETRYYYILAWSEKVLDIREQFPLLPLSETEEIAAALGYKHPRAPGGACDEVMTTDFLLTVRGSDSDPAPHLEARYVKYEKDMANKRTCENCRSSGPFGLPTMSHSRLSRRKALILSRQRTSKRYWDITNFPRLIRPMRSLRRVQRRF